MAEEGFEETIVNEDFPESFDKFHYDVRKIAEFAVEEHNREKKDHLKLVRVVKYAKRRLAGGMYFTIVLEATDGKVARKYGAVVLVRLRSGAKVLLQFYPIDRTEDEAALEFDEMLMLEERESIDASNNNSAIDDLARFAVQEYNTLKHKNLVFVKVLSASKKRFAKVMVRYTIDLLAKDGAKQRRCRAKIVQTPWPVKRNILQSFQVIA